MEVSVAGFDALYRLIGPAGLALCVVALFALYVGLWQLFYMSAVWRNFKHDWIWKKAATAVCVTLIPTAPTP
ncbi:MAG: hypothetical protein V8R49_03660 [Duodenibacillus massiliensis]